MANKHTNAQDQNQMPTLVILLRTTKSRPYHNKIEQDENGYGSNRRCQLRKSRNHENHPFQPGVKVPQFFRQSDDLDFLERHGSERIQQPGSLGGDNGARGGDRAARRRLCHLILVLVRNDSDWSFCHLDSRRGAL